MGCARGAYNRGRWGPQMVAVWRQLGGEADFKVAEHPARLGYRREGRGGGESREGGGFKGGGGGGGGPQMVAVWRQLGGEADFKVAEHPARLGYRREGR